MAVTDREASITSAEQLRWSNPAEPATLDADGWSLSAEVQAVLASLALGAGAIHVAMAPSHASAWLAEGIAFAVAGWLQVATAFVLVVRPSRRLLGVACVANALFLTAWAWTRVLGPPFGPEAGIAHTVGLVDFMCVALEAAFIIGCCLALRRASVGELRPSRRAMLPVVPIGVLLLATGAIVSPSAADHVHHETSVASSSHAHTPASSGGAHVHDAATHAAAEIAFLFPDGDDRGWGEKANGTQHVMAPEVPLAQLEPSVRTELQRQLNLTLDVVRQYPTVAAAEAAGYRRQGPFTPGLGAHYIGAGQYNMSGPLTDDQILHPSAIIYDGTAPDSAIAGFMYIALSPDPEGFAGPNDQWHVHADVCNINHPDGTSDNLGADGTITQAQCEQQGGSFIATTTMLLHVWTAPGYTDPLGVFGHLNPALTCGDGTYFTGPKGTPNECLHP